MPNLKEIDLQEGCLWLAQSYFCKWCEEEEEKGEENRAIFRNTYLANYWTENLVCRVAYIEGIKYVNLIEIGRVVIIEIRGAENGELAVPVNNTLVRHTAFLAADTRPCVLIPLTLKHHCFTAMMV